MPEPVGFERYVAEHLAGDLFTSSQALSNMPPTHGEIQTTKIRMSFGLPLDLKRARLVLLLVQMDAL